MSGERWSIDSTRPTAGAGDPSHTERAVALVERLLTSATPTDAELLALARAGWVDRAAGLARRRPADTLAMGLAAAAQGAADATARFDGGPPLVGAPPTPPSRARALALEAGRAADDAATMVEVAVALAATGTTDQARRMLERAAGRRSPWAAHRGATAVDLARVAEALAGHGERNGAAELVEQAEGAATVLPATGWREDALARVAVAWCRVSDLDRARRVLGALTLPWGQVEGWLAVAEAQPGTTDARAAVERATVAARAESYPDWRAEALARVVRALAESGDRERAGVVTAEITDPVWRAEAEVARATAARLDGEVATAEGHEAAARAAAAGCGYGWWHQTADGLQRLARARATTAGAEVGLAITTWVDPVPLKARIVQGAAEGRLQRRPGVAGVDDVVRMTDAIRALGPAARRLEAALVVLRVSRLMGDPTTGRRSDPCGRRPSTGPS